MKYFYVVFLFFRRDEAANRPKREFTPKTLADLHVEGISSDDINGASIFHVPLPSRPKNHNYIPQPNQNNYNYQPKGDAFYIIFVPLRHERLSGNIYNAAVAYETNDCTLNTKSETVSFLFNFIFTRQIFFKQTR